MSPHVETAVVATKTVTLVLGAFITYLGYKAYRRTGARALRALAIGFGIITLGSLLAGVLDLLTPLDFMPSVLVNSILTLIGFGIITYSLYVE